MATFSNEFLSSGEEEQGKLNFKSHPKKSEKSLMNWVTKTVSLSMFLLVYPEARVSSDVPFPGDCEEFKLMREKSLFIIIVKDQ